MRPLFKAFLIVLLILVGIFIIGIPSQAKLCGVHGDSPCAQGEKGECCTGTICDEDTDTCIGGLFTKGQSDICLEQGNCSRCDFLIIVKNVFQFLVQIAAALAVLGIVISGIMYMTGGGIIGAKALEFQPTPAGIETAKKALTSVIIGLLIVLFAWSMITWMMHFLGYEQAVGHAWWSIQCQAEYQYKCSCYIGGVYQGGKGPYSTKATCEAACTNYCKKEHEGSSAKCERY